MAIDPDSDLGEDLRNESKAERRAVTWLQKGNTKEVPISPPIFGPYNGI